MFKANVYYLWSSPNECGQGSRVNRYKNLPMVASPLGVCCDAVSIINGPHTHTQCDRCKQNNGNGILNYLNGRRGLPMQESGLGEGRRAREKRKCLRPRRDFLYYISLQHRQRRLFHTAIFWGTETIRKQRCQISIILTVDVSLFFPISQLKSRHALVKL